MKIVVFGASGRLGRLVVGEALARGHRVTAFLRTPSGESAARPGLSIAFGDALDPPTIAPAVRGQDAVVSALGPSGFYRGRTDDVLSTGMANLAAEMHAAGVERIIAVSGSGVLQATPTTLRLELPDFPPFLRALAEEHRKAYEILGSSDLDWTLVCPPRMLPGGGTGQCRVRADYFPPNEAAVRYADVASFIAAEVEDRRFSRKRVGISG